MKKKKKKKNVADKIIWCLKFKDLKNKPKYLVNFTVGWAQRNNIDAAVEKVRLFYTNYAIYI